MVSPVLQVGDGDRHVVLVTLQHGDELLGLDTALRLCAERLRARLTLIVAASPLAFLDGRRRTADSFDGLSLQPSNLNARHAGRTVDRVADLISRKLNERIHDLVPDFVLDLHAAGLDSVPHLIVDDVPMQGTLNDVVQDALIPWYQEAADSGASPLAGSLTATWCRLGTPAMTLELGPRGGITPPVGQRAGHALRNVLAALKSIEMDSIASVEPQLVQMLKGRIGRAQEVRYEGSQAGYLRILIPAGTPIQEGDVLANIVVPATGEAIDVTSPTDGALLIWNSEWRVLPGSSLGQVLVAMDA